MGETRIDYVAIAASTSPADTTHLRLRLDDRRQELWIADLRVAIDLRCRGIGRRLVRCAERTAEILQIPLVSAFPLKNVSAYWERLGYTNHPRKAGVFAKVIFD